MIQTISAPHLKQWIDDGEAVLIDVREPDEYRAEHIVGSIHLPLGTITAGQLPDLQGKKLVIHCRSGKRSESACQKLMAESPALQPINLSGGIVGWVEAGLETRKGG